MTDTTAAPSTGAATDAAVRAAITSLVADPSDASGYAALTDRSARRRVRDAVEARIKSTLATVDPTDADAAAAAITEWKRLTAIHQSLSAVRSSSATGTDPYQLAADRAATYRLAADLIDGGMVHVDGTDGPAVVGWDGTDGLVGRASYADAVALAESKLAVRGPNQFRTVDGFRAAFDGEPVGTFLTIAQVRDRWHAVGGPADADGRLSARAFAEGGCTIDWIEPVPATGDTARGVRLTGPVPA